MRIIGGDFKGRKLRSVPGSNIRPTADRTREAIFNILASRVRGSNVLDLFAGTGAFGIEALSRGADSAFFIDCYKEPISVLRRNLEDISLESRSKILQWNIAKSLDCLRSLQTSFNLIFLDPPYNKNLIIPTLSNLHNSRSVRKGACVVIEHSQHESISFDESIFKQSDQRKYGKTLVSFFNYML